MAKDKTLKATISAKGTEIAVFSTGNDDDHISLTDIAKYKNSEFPADVVKNWLRTRSTIEFLGLWEQLNNQDFKPVEFDQFKIKNEGAYFGTIRTPIPVTCGQRNGYMRTAKRNIRTPCRVNSLDGTL